MLDRYRSAARRAIADGRLPESVSRLWWELFRLSTRNAWHRLVGAMLPPHGFRYRGGQAVWVGGELRRWKVSSETKESAFELKHRFAQDCVSLIRQAGIQVFLVSDQGDHLEFGMVKSDAPAAFDAISTLGSNRLWYLRARRGHRETTRILGPSFGAGHTSDAESWRVHQVYSTGRGGVVGIEQAVQFSFYVPEDGVLQRVGVRGLARVSEDSSESIEVVDGHEYPGLDALPVSGGIHTFEHAIDIVYTWVDSNDPEWRAAFEQSRSAAGLESVGSTHPSRFRSNEELRYSLRSVWLNAGWARRVFIVTSGQKPDWLIEDERLRLVTHDEIMPTSALPTFNSHAIEANLHHIEDLSEHFIYMNDDVFLTRPLQPKAFFTANGLIRFTESKASIELSSAALGRAEVDEAAINGRRLIEQEFGKRLRNKLDHAPHPLRRSVLYELEGNFPEVNTTTMNAFRSSSDLALASGLSQQYAYLTGRAIESDLVVGYQNLENPRLGQFLRRVLAGRDYDSICINETEAVVEPNDGPAKLMVDFLETYFSARSLWENPS